MRNSSLLAAPDQQNVDESVFKFAEEQREIEQLHATIIQLEKQLDRKKNLELEFEQLQGKLKLLNKADTLLKDLSEKEEVLQEMDALSQILIVKERKSNEQLQEARSELLKFMTEVPGCANIGVKRIGQLDGRPFLEAMRKKYNGKEAEERASELCSLWQECLLDPNWYPFQVITVDEGKLMEVINDDDEKLNELKNEIGEGAYEAVVTALREINEHNPSGRCISSEIWNYWQGRRATLKEGVQYLMKKWKNHKRKRGMR